MPEEFLLIPGRTSRQGAGISEGKFKYNYADEIRRLQMTSEDMERLGFAPGDWVKVTSEFGEIKVRLVASKKDELPSGLLFIAYGDLSSRLMGGDTHGSGMPTSKGFEVTVVATTAPEDDGIPPEDE